MYLINYAEYLCDQLHKIHNLYNTLGIASIFYIVSTYKRCVFRVIHPVKYYRDFLNHEIRPDGRELDQFRPIVINVNSIGTSDGSAIVKIGNTTVVCGIKAVSFFCIF